MTAVIRTHQLTRRFGTVTAVDRVDLEIARGERLVLVGSNGAGRTTLLQMLATTLSPSSGAMEVCGIDAVRQPLAARRHVMSVSSRGVSGAGLLVREHVRLVADARRVPLSATAIGAALSRAGVPEHFAVDQLSTGLRQRLALTTALLVAPAVLLLDDPLAGIDADARTTFIDWINESRGGPMTIVAALNHDDQIGRLCDSVLEMRGGRLGARVGGHAPVVAAERPAFAGGGA